MKVMARMFFNARAMTLSSVVSSATSYIEMMTLPDA